MTRILATLILFHALTLSAAGDAVDEQLQAIRKVQDSLAALIEARRACEQLAGRGPEILPRLLEELDTPKLVVGNWYRTVFDDIVDRELAKPRPNLPVDLFRGFVRNAKREGRARRLVLARLDVLDPAFRSQLIPILLDDPEFRPDAIAQRIKRGDEAKANQDTKAAQLAYREAFEHAQAAAQIQLSAARLRSVGEQVNVVERMGFVVDWYLLGPFDAPEFSGFEARFPPEERVDLEAIYPGKTGSKIRWRPYHTPDGMGQINLIKEIAAVKEAVGYAYAELNSPRKQAAQLRCGADDNLTVWLNGEKVFSRRQWLNGTRLDRFRADVQLLQGKNTVLVKICQGPQHKNPAVPNNWSLQLRFCNPDGISVGLTPLNPAGESK